MSSCQDESHDRGHGNGHDHDHAHDHSEDLSPALQSLLWDKIDFSGVNCFNEKKSGSAVAILKKPWSERLAPDPLLESDADEQLLIVVPFTGQVKLHSILLRTSASPSAPRTIKVFLNATNLDFAAASSSRATQILEVSQTSDVQEIPVKRALFNSTQSVTLFISDNWSGGDEDVTTLSYLSFKGDFMKLSKEPIDFIYEAAANPADHRKISGMEKAGHDIGGDRSDM